jgi:hypothetical protein
MKCDILTAFTHTINILGLCVTVLVCTLVCVCACVCTHTHTTHTLSHTLTHNRFIPPLVLTKAHCAEFVTPFVNPDGTLGRTGFQGLMTSVLRKYQMREIAKGMNAKSWGQVSLKGIMMGSMGLVREVFSCT